MSVALRKFLVVTLALLLLVAAGLVIARKRTAPAPPDSSSAPSQALADLAGQFKAIEAREDQLDKTVYAKELLALACGQVLDSLWDSLNAATNKLGVLQSFPTGKLILGKFNPAQMLACGIELREPAAGGTASSSPEWRKFLEESERAGWQLAQTEFRHTRFETDESGRPRRSRFYFRADLVNAAREDRATLEGDLVVDWAPQVPGTESPVIQQIDASRLKLRTRHGKPPFREILAESIAPPDKSHFIDPLILYDLDGDGVSEIILAARNLVYRRRGPDRYESGPLCKNPPGLIFTGIIADFDGDGAADFLCAKFEGLVLFKGSAGGAFDEPGRLVWAAKTRLKYAQVLTCGDVNQDGSPDVFLGQYKAPYESGQMPQPYYDANDGYPAYLLLNDGHGNFTDATDISGLSGKRWRRSYSGSFADLDGDGDRDLVVVSDFAGVDLYRNDGHGLFTDVTQQWVGEPHSLGMAHALTDFNADGRLDLLMIGMNSPAADRLEHLGLWRAGVPEDRTKRAPLTFGNRLYLGRSNGRLEPTSSNDSIARSGWSWGTSAADFDNDGFPDVYVANGHRTLRSVRDYESEFWRHDIYVGRSQEDAAANAYFQTKFRRTFDQSYGGHELNRLYLNQHGASFVEAGYLLGVALPEDSRGVVSDDLDGDGRMDLLVTTFEIWPEVKQTLRVFKNTMNDPASWIGFRFQEEGGGKSPVGAELKLHSGNYSAIRQIVTGDSYRSQHANTVHFGLGKTGQVDRVEIRWADGRTLTLREPALNQYHRIQAPIESPAHP